MTDNNIVKAIQSTGTGYLINWSEEGFKFLDGIEKLL